jgi:hypothetical protein
VDEVVETAALQDDAADVDDAAETEDAEDDETLDVDADDALAIEEELTEVTEDEETLMIVRYSMRRQADARWLR